MADGVTISVRGIEGVKEALNALSADLRRKVVRGALRAAAKPVINAAKSFAPILASPTRRRVPGTIRRNIKAFNSKKANGSGGVIGVYVSVKASKKDLKRAPVSGDPYYWRWVEGGHKIVPRSRRVGTRYGKAKYAQTLRSRRSGASGFVAARGFLLAAYRTQGAAAIRIFSEQILARIAKANQVK